MLLFLFFERWPIVVIIDMWYLASSSGSWHEHRHVRAEASRNENRVIVRTPEHTWKWNIGEYFSINNI